MADKDTQELVDDETAEAEIEKLELSIKVDKPIVFDNQHHWRLDGDHLITTYDDSDLPQDADFFAMLDRQPWVRVP